MRDFFKRVFNQIGAIWKKWSLVQQGVFVAVLIVAIIGSFLILRISGAPTSVALFSRPITDQKDIDRIAARLDEEQVEYTITNDQRILVDSLQTARKLRTILASEDLIPGNTDPWDLFDIERWTQTDFERNINFRRALTRQIEQHIEALDDIDAANVTLVIPEVQLFVEDQNPTTASVILSIKPGSDLRGSTAKIEGIQKLVQFAIEGLQAENITITDTNGVVLNDFAGADLFDRVALARSELKIKKELERQYINSIYRALAQIYGEDRVEIINIDVTVDMGVKTQETEEFYPIETVPDNPSTPFSEREFVLTIPRSVETIDESFEGSGFNPQGPPGQEGQTPPAYQDVEDLAGRYNNDQERVNNEINQRKIFEEKRPEITRVTAAVAIDGTWRTKYNENGRMVTLLNGSVDREYIPVDGRSLLDAQELIQDAVGYNPARGDSVSVRHLQFDRSDEFEREDQVYRRRQALIGALLYSVVALIALFILFLIARAINVSVRRKRSLRAEELARQQQLLADSIFQEENPEFPANYINESDMLSQAARVSRDHPKEVAQLLRSWVLGV